jgi:hypothetical protein
MNARFRPAFELSPTHSGLIDLAATLGLLAESGPRTRADVVRCIEATGKALPELTIGELSRILAEES